MNLTNHYQFRIVLFDYTSVAPDDFNWFDQQKIIDTLWDEHGIMSMKMTYDECMVEGELKSDNRYEGLSASPVTINVELYPSQ